MARGEVEHLKEVLNKVNADLTRREEELWKATSKIIKTEKMAKD